jgi:hypothetical protein
MAGKYEGFAKLSGELSKKKGVSDPAGLAAMIGRRKYGVAKFNSAAAKGKKLGPGK